jgi:hypothetical protein
MSQANVSTVKTNVQFTVKYNDELKTLISEFVTKYNSIVDALNNTIEITKSIIKDSDLTECQDMIEFMGDKKNHLSTQDLYDLVSSDYTLVKANEFASLNDNKSLPVQLPISLKPFKFQVSEEDNDLNSVTEQIEKDIDSITAVLDSYDMI